MFDSKITASALIEQVKSETDIALPIPEDRYIDWLNALEQLLYSEVIKEQGRITIDSVEDGCIDIEDKKIRFEDIHAVYADSTQLIKSTVASGVIFPNTYFKEDNKLMLNIDTAPDSVDVVYIVRPELKTTDNISTTNVMLPIEFIELASAKLRGEAYKLANEGELAAMWLNDYNILLETFKAWISQRQPSFGL